jgi:class 3 adenylate cyclase
MPVLRRLAIILAADVAGYARLVRADEEGTFRRLRAHRGELIEVGMVEHRGRIAWEIGDGLLVRD